MRDMQTTRRHAIQEEYPLYLLAYHALGAGTALPVSAA
jgi:hypothetical protein